MPTGEEISQSQMEENLPSNVESSTGYEIVDLQPKQQRFIHLYVTGQYTLQELSQLLEMHPNTLGNWLKRKDISSIIVEMQSTNHEIVATQLKALTSKAANKLSGLIDSPIDGVALQAVKDILDRGGHKPQQKISVDKKVVTYEQRLNNLIDDVIDITDYEVDSDE